MNNTDLYKGYIYQIDNSENQFKYIGQTVRDPTLRFKQHIKDALCRCDDYIFHKAIRELGKDKFSISVLHVIEDKNIKKIKDKLDELEKYYINLNNTKFPNGYNMTLGGQGVQPKSVNLYNYDGELLKQFSSLEEAAFQCNCTPSVISNNCRGVSLGTNWGIFRFKEDSFDKYPICYRPNGGKVIVLYDYFGNKIKEYISISEYAKEYFITKTSGSRYLNSHLLVDYKYVIFLKNQKFDQSLITFPNYKPIICFKNNEKFYYRNASIAARDNNTDPSSTIKCCKGKLKRLNGNIYQYADELDYINYLIQERKHNDKAQTLNY